MSGESTALALIKRTDDELHRLAERLANSELLPKELRGKVPDVMMQIMAGQELGLAPMASLRSFSIIQGKPVMSADAMVAIVLGSGQAEYFRRVEESDDRVTYATKRHGAPERRCSWTMEMAKKASLHQKDNWRGYPRAMLASRAKSELARDVYPDVLAGVFTGDEMAERPPVSSHRDVVDAEFTEVPAPVQTSAPLPASPPVNLSDYPEITKINKAISVEELKALADAFSKHGLRPRHPAYDAMNSAYKARLSWVKSRSASTTDALSTSADSSSASTGEPTS